MDDQWRHRYESRARDIQLMRRRLAQAERRVSRLTGELAMVRAELAESRDARRLDQWRRRAQAWAVMVQRMRATPDLSRRTWSQRTIEHADDVEER